MGFIKDPHQMSEIDYIVSDSYDIPRLLSVSYISSSEEKHQKSTTKKSPLHLPTTVK